MNTNNISMWEVQLKITYEDYKLDNDRAIILHQLLNKFSAIEKLRGCSLFIEPDCRRKNWVGEVNVDIL